MSCASRDKDRAHLEREIRGRSCQELLDELQRDGFLREFPTWPDVLRFMHSKGEDETAKDGIIRAVLHRRSGGDDPRWQTILLLTFWPGLESILWQNRSRNPDLLDRWQDVVCAFMAAASRLDVEKRADRLASKLFNDTVHRLRDMYRYREKATVDNTAVDPDQLPGLAGTAECRSLELVDIADEHAALSDHLSHLIRAGSLSEPDLRLILDTRVNGRSLSDAAKAEGLTYEAAKKRRQRAESLIRNFGENKKT